ncbi:MAG: site-specific DNA-methyltransferase [Candidatus Hydrogenedentota bacterium]|nr:MAG: site-specific DNA-methyltransferase [Candidatus Hydrogenedentota bacterium]
MANKSHFNSGLKALNQQRREGKKHSAKIDNVNITKTIQAFYTEDAIKFLKKVPDNSIQLILVDPPYNLDLDTWDTFENYLEWARQWLDEIFRVLSPTGNCVIFGGFQYQDLKKGDLLEILHYTRHNTDLRFTNLVIWYYKNGMSAHRYFANRHEEAVWLTKTKKYYFDLDSVRSQYTPEQKKLALKDKRLIPENIEKGKNPTNVWEIGRLNGNSKERVGHPTQKPLEIIRRFVKSLSYEGSTVLDFFAGSGTTARVCVEENRHSIMVDSDEKTLEYFKEHIEKKENQVFHKPFEQHINKDLKNIFKLIQSSNTYKSEK